MSAYNHTPLADPPPLRLFRVEEKGRKRWTFTTMAQDEERARQLARECGFFEPATVEEVAPEPDDKPRINGMIHAVMCHAAVTSDP